MIYINMVYIYLHTYNIHAYCIDLWVNAHVHMLTQRYTHRHGYTSMYIHVGTHEYKYILLARPKEMPPADFVKWSCRGGQQSSALPAVLGPPVPITSNPCILSMTRGSLAWIFPSRASGWK